MSNGVAPEREVVVTGAGGQVGSALRGVLGGARFLSHGDLDVVDEDAVRRAVGGASVVVHLAAMTNVDECERDPDRAFAVNAEGTRNVVQAAAEAGARVIHVSTDYVFDGEKAGEYSEDDPPGPVSVYGRSKLEGERFVAKEAGNLIVRTSWVFGEGRNFIRTIVGAARKGDPLTIVDDQTGRPTWADDLAGAMAFAMEAGISGVLHVTGDGEPATWADVAELALREAGLPASIRRTDSESYRRAADSVIAPRPRNSVLSLDKARTHGVPLQDWRASVRRYVETLS